MHRCLLQTAESDPHGSAAPAVHWPAGHVSLLGAQGTYRACSFGVQWHLVLHQVQPAARNRLCVQSVSCTDDLIAAAETSASLAITEIAAVGALALLAARIQCLCVQSMDWKETVAGCVCACAIDSLMLPWFWSPLECKSVWIGKHILASIENWLTNASLSMLGIRNRCPALRKSQFFLFALRCNSHVLT